MEAIDIATCGIVKHWFVVNSESTCIWLCRELLGCLGWCCCCWWCWSHQGCCVLPNRQNLIIQLCLIWPTHLGSDLYPIQSSHHKFLYSLVLIKQLPNCPYPFSVSKWWTELTWSSFLQASRLDKPDVSSQKADHRSAGASGSVDQWHQGKDRADLSSTPLILQPSMRDMHTIMVPYSAMTSTHARLYLVRVPGSHCMHGSCHIIHPTRRWAPMLHHISQL